MVWGSAETIVKSTNIITLSIFSVHLLEHAKNLHGEDCYCFKTRFCAIPQSQRHPEVVEKQFANFLLDWMILAKYKTPLTKIRDKMPQQLVRAAYKSFKKRCRAVVKE
jgi:hypothetical protein